MDFWLLLHPQCPNHHAHPSRACLSSALPHLITPHVPVNHGLFTSHVSLKCPTSACPIVCTLVQNPQSSCSVTQCWCMSGVECSVPVSNVQQPLCLPEKPGMCVTCVHSHALLCYIATKDNCLKVFTSLLPQGLLSSSGQTSHLLVNASAMLTVQQSATSELVAMSDASDAPTHSSAATLPSLHLVWVCCAQAAIQSAVLAVGTGTPTITPDPSPGAPARSILQESFWRHSRPQVKALQGSSAAHPALDWLYPALAAVAAVEQAVLHPSSGLTYGTQFDVQVCVHRLMRGRHQAHVLLQSL